MPARARSRGRVIGGLEADVVALALAPDVESIAKAKLITHDWTSAEHKGIVSNSVVAFAVRQGNPKGIHDWADLAQPGLAVLTPDAATSGGARWNILGLYGAALRGQVSGLAKDDQKGAQDFLAAVLKNVTVFDKDARTSVTTFEKGIGDVAITYENEVLLGQQRGQDYELVIPRSTIPDRNPGCVGRCQRRQAWQPRRRPGLRQFFVHTASAAGVRPVRVPAGGCGDRPKHSQPVPRHRRPVHG